MIFSTFTNVIRIIQIERVLHPIEIKDATTFTAQLDSRDTFIESKVCVKSTMMQRGSKPQLIASKSPIHWGRWRCHLLIITDFHFMLKSKLRMSLAHIFKRHAVHRTRKKTATSLCKLKLTVENESGIDYTVALNINMVFFSSHSHLIATKTEKLQRFNAVVVVVFSPYLV